MIIAGLSDIDQEQKVLRLGFEQQQRSYTYWLDGIGIALLVAVVYFSLIGLRGFATPDEGRYAEIGREMLLRGHYLIPTLDFAHYLQKPPLYYWVMAFSLKLFGIHDYAARVPNAFFATLGAVLTYGFARFFYDRRTGILAALILSTSLLYFIMAQSNSVDMLLSTLVMTALYSFLWGQAQSNRRLKCIAILLAYALSGLAVLDKGLIGIALPLMFIGVWLALRFDWSLLRRSYLLFGALVFLAVTVPWHIAVEYKIPGFLHYYFIEQQYLRYLTAVTNHVMPTWQYLSYAVLSVFPFSLLLLACAYDCLVGKNMALLRDKQHSTTLFLIIWPLVLIVFFAFSYSKLVPYLLPVCAPFAILLADYCSRHWQQQPKLGSWFIINTFVLIAILLTVAAFGFWAKAWLHPVLQTLDQPLQGELALRKLGIVALLSVALALIALGLKSVKAHVSAWIMISVLLCACLLSVINPFNTRSTKGLAQQLRPLLQQHPNAEVVNLDIYPQDFIFYLQLKRPLYVVNWRSDELLYAAEHDRKAQQWLINDQRFWHKWREQPLYVLMMHDRVQSFLSQAAQIKRPARIIAQTKRYGLLTNIQ